MRLKGDGKVNASMEPRFFNHGKKGMVGGKAVVDGASMEPRFFNHGKLTIPSGSPNNGFRFNGATVFQPWENGHPHWPHCSRTTLQWSHGFSTMGNQKTIWGRPTVLSGFNGATVFQPWEIAPSSNAAGSPECCFNGATVFQPWETHRQ